jgi:hypothetical protein
MRLPFEFEHEWNKSGPDDLQVQYGKQRGQSKE